MSNPTPPDDLWPSQPSRAARQVHAVLSWLVVEADAPNDVHLHLVDALLAWAALIGDHLFPTEPEAGVDGDLDQVLEGTWRRLDAEAGKARWADKIVLNQVRGRIGLGMRALRPWSAGASVTGRLRDLGPPGRSRHGGAAAGRRSSNPAWLRSARPLPRRRPGSGARWRVVRRRGARPGLARPVPASPVVGPVSRTRR
jgi:hypothetical protein